MIWERAYAGRCIRCAKRSVGKSSRSTEIRRSCRDFADRSNRSILKDREALARFALDLKGEVGA
jgi:hypothetical protein